MKMEMDNLLSISLPFTASQQQQLHFLKTQSLN